MNKELEIQYIDTYESNYYDPERESIILDRKLKEDFPKAHEYILKHEEKHHEIGFNIPHQAWLDIKNAYFLSISESETANECREYFSNNSFELPTKEHLVYTASNLISGLIGLPLMIFGTLYRKLKNLI